NGFESAGAANCRGFSSRKRRQGSRSGFRIILFDPVCRHDKTLWSITDEVKRVTGDKRDFRLWRRRQNPAVCGLDDLNLVHAILVGSLERGQPGKVVPGYSSQWT